MIQPPFLKAGDKVAVISTARKIDRSVVDDASTFLKDWGLEVVYGENLFSEQDQYAGTDEQRIHDLQWAMDEKDIRAIFCARGGYGTVRLIDSIDFSGFESHPKWLIGYSDITILHAHLQQVVGSESLHASMLINFMDNPEEVLTSLQYVLFGEELTYELDPNPHNRIGQSEGILVGGNLSVLYSMMGSRSFPDMKGKILFIEDLDEYLYHIDRMMMNLKRAGVFEDLGGLIVGGMTDMNDNDIPFGKTAIEIVSDAVADYKFPVCFDFPAGHIDQNMPLVFGKNTRLSVSDEEVIIAN